MWLHYCLFAGIAGLGLIYKPNNRIRTHIYYAGIFLVIFILATFRAYTVGNDTSEYLRVFNLVRSYGTLSKVFETTRYEIGYMMLNFIIGKFTSNFTVLLAVITAFYVWSVLQFINKYATDPKTAVLLCFSLSVFYDVMITMRQCIAIAIFLLSVEYLIKRKLIKYFALIVIATLFHSIAIVLIFLYFCPRTDWGKAKDFFLWYLIVIVALIGVNFINVITKYAFPYFSHYFSTAYAEGGIRIASIVFLLVRLLIIGLLFSAGGFKFASDFRGEKNVFMQLMLIDCIIAAMSILFNIIDRVENFFCIGFIVAVINVMRPLSISNKQILKWIIIAIAFVHLSVCLILRSNWYGLFPYQFL